MIANDIVCHKEFNRSEKYFDKIKSASEVEISSFFGSAICLSAIFFSIKEAAYKVLLKQNFSKAFAPAMYHITQLKTVYQQNRKFFYLGRLKYEDYNFFFISTSTILYTHSIVSSTQVDFNLVQINIHYYPKLNYKNQSTVSEIQLARQICKSLELDGHISIIKNSKGIPAPIIKNDFMNIEVSISHDGNYIATIIYYPEKHE